MEENVRDDISVVCQVVNDVHGMAYQPDAVNLDACFKRRESREFMYLNNIRENDVAYMLSMLTVEQYSHTSKKPGNPDAYVFGVSDYLVDCMIYLKFQIIDGIIVLSLHEPKWTLTFPY